jgi:transposase
MDIIRNRDNSFQWNPQDGIPTFQIHTRPLKRPKRANTTRDQRRNCKMAYRCGLDDYQIAEKVGIDVRQVRYALDNEAPTPKKKSGRPPLLDAEQRQQLVDFVCSSRKTRRMTYKELAKEFCYWNCGSDAIKTALDKEGFKVRIAMCKPLISEKNRKL